LIATIAVEIDMSMAPAADVIKMPAAGSAPAVPQATTRDVLNPGAVCAAPDSLPLK